MADEIVPGAGVDLDAGDVVEMDELLTMTQDELEEKLAQAPVEVRRDLLEILLDVRPDLKLKEGMRGFATIFGSTVDAPSMGAGNARRANEFPEEAPILNLTEEERALLAKQVLDPKIDDTIDQLKGIDDAIEAMKDQFDPLVRLFDTERTTTASVAGARANAVGPGFLAAVDAFTGKHDPKEAARKAGLSEEALATINTLSLVPDSTTVASTLWDIAKNLPSGTGATEALLDAAVMEFKNKEVAPGVVINTTQDLLDYLDTSLGDPTDPLRPASRLAENYNEDLLKPRPRPGLDPAKLDAALDEMQTGIKNIGSTYSTFQQPVTEYAKALAELGILKMKVLKGELDKIEADRAAVKIADQARTKGTAGLLGIDPKRAQQILDTRTALSEFSDILMEHTSVPRSSEEIDKRLKQGEVLPLIAGKLGLDVNANTEQAIRALTQHARRLRSLEQRVNRARGGAGAPLPQMNERGEVTGPRDTELSPRRQRKIERLDPRAEQYRKLFTAPSGASLGVDPQAKYYPAGTRTVSKSTASTGMSDPNQAKSAETAAEAEAAARKAATLDMLGRINAGASSYAQSIPERLPVEHTPIALPVDQVDAEEEFADAEAEREWVTKLLGVKTPPTGMPA